MADARSLQRLKRAVVAEIEAVRKHWHTQGHYPALDVQMEDAKKSVRGLFDRRISHARKEARRG